MSQVKMYNYEKFSVRDIEKFLKERNYSVSYQYSKNPNVGSALIIAGTDVSVDLPLRSKSTGVIFADIRFESYPRTERYEQSKKLYRELSAVFGVKQGEVPRNIKDEGEINKMVNEG